MGYGSGVAIAIAQIQSLAQELPYAMGVAIKKKKIDVVCKKLAQNEKKLMKF